MRDEFYDLSEPLQKAVLAEIGRCEANGRQTCTVLDKDYETYAYPNAHGGISWGVNAAHLGWANYKRGICSIADTSPCSEER